MKVPGPACSTLLLGRQPAPAPMLSPPHPPTLLPALCRPPPEKPQTDAQAKEEVAPSRPSAGASRGC